MILISVYDLNAAIMKYNTKAKIRRGQCATNNDFNKLLSGIVISYIYNCLDYHYQNDFFYQKKKDLI